MSFNFTEKDSFIMYKNKYFFNLDTEGHLFLSTNPPSINFSFDNVYPFRSEGIFINKKCSDLDGSIFEIDENFVSVVDCIEFNNELFLLFYHVTLAENLESIKSEGLKPSIGYFSSSLGETKPYVYLFSNLDNMETALGNWMGAAYEDYCEENDLDFDSLELASLYVKVPISEIHELLFPSIVGYEAISDKTIPSHYLHYHSEQ